jgi:hypothetical protein
MKTKIMFTAKQNRDFGKLMWRVGFKDGKIQTQKEISNRLKKIVIKDNLISFELGIFMKELES